MARLYDRVMAQPYRTPMLSAFEESPGPVVTLDNVARYWYEALPDYWEYSDFPNVAPPFASAFLEYRYTPQRARSRGFEWPSNYPAAWGAVVAAFQGDAAKEIWDSAPHWRAGCDVDLGGVEWLVLMEVFCTGSMIDNPAPVGITVGGVRKDGSASGFASAANPNIYSQKDIDDASADIGRSCLPFLLATSFMHCKNVERREVVPPRPLDKKWQKKGNKPLVRYHVLDIDPMRKVLRDEGKSEETGLKKALHICRGHFAHYPDGLFGRGEPETVWKPQHIRGSKSEGLVLKDYRVNSP